MPRVGAATAWLRFPDNAGGVACEESPLAISPSTSARDHVIDDQLGGLPEGAPVIHLDLSLLAGDTDGEGGRHP